METIFHQPVKGDLGFFFDFAISSLYCGEQTARPGCPLDEAYTDREECG
jgi:hypothetical protein